MLIGHWKIKENIAFYIHKECKCGNNTNYTNSMIMHNRMQSSMLLVTLCKIHLVAYGSVITIPTPLFCGDNHSVPIRVSFFDLCE